MQENNNDSWLPDEDDAVDLSALPKPAAFKPKPAAEVEVSTGLSLTPITGEDNQPSVSVDDAPKYSFGGSSTGIITGGVDDAPKNYKKKKFPERKPYKKKIERDWEEKPATDDELPRLMKSAEGTVLWHLARREMTVKMLRDKLKAKNKYPNHVIEAMLQKCIDNNWVNDERYAESFTRSKKEYSKLGKNAIKRELMLKGVDSETAAAAVADIDNETEREAAMQLVLKQLPKTQNLEKQKRVNRLLGMLARKGYPSDIAFSVIREALDAEIIEEDW
jgi:regulatory protein